MCLSTDKGLAIVDDRGAVGDRAQSSLRLLVRGALTLLGVINDHIDYKLLLGGERMAQAPGYWQPPDPPASKPKLEEGPSHDHPANKLKGGEGASEGQPAGEPKGSKPPKSSLQASTGKGKEVKEAPKSSEEL